jgi:uncharacterized membrane protein
MTANAPASRLPAVRQITAADVRAAIGQGMKDLARAPLYSLFFGCVFSGFGILISYLLVVVGSSYWVPPLAAGFPLIGPFAAVGLYEISRRLEAREPLDWRSVLGAVLRQGKFQLPSYAFITLFVYLIWVYLAHLIFALSFGLKPLTNVMTSFDLLLSAEGIGMLVAGTVVGGAIAAFLFSISVTSVPMLLDREIDVISAIVTSVKSVLVNRGAMLFWGITIAICCALAMLPMFIGMIVVFPVLGHASWHIYRRSVEPSA